jgi:3-oxoacyl-[acyl-carrier protein] reductase
VAKRVLVTGSSRGIGRAIAVRLSSEGWIPLIHYRAQQEDAKEAAEASGGELAPFGCDLSSAEECKELFNWATKTSPIDALVNNAGIYKPAAFDASEREFEESWASHYEANFLSTLRLARMFVLQSRPGTVLNVCSRVGYRGEAGASAYAASKAAQINLVRSLSVELAPKNIRVVGIAPGWVETAMTRPGMESRRAEIESGIPLGRVATPEDCAAVCSFLLSDDAAYLSGVVIDINGASYFH